MAHHERLAGRDDLAAEHFRRAGDHARAVYANADARAHYDAALALGHPAVAELHEAIGDLETLDGRFADAVASFERAAARSRPRTTSPASRASSVASTSGAASGRPPSSTTTRPSRALGDEGPLVDRARLTADLAITAHRQGDTERAAELADEAVALAERAGDDAALAHTGTVAGPPVGRPGRPRDGPGAARRRASTGPPGSATPPPRWPPPTGWPASSGWPATSLAPTRCSPRRCDVCVSIGDRHREAALRDQLAQVLHGLGRHDEAMDELKRAVAIFADIGVEGGSIQTEVWRLERVGRPQPRAAP